MCDLFIFALPYAHLLDGLDIAPGCLSALEVLLEAGQVDISDGLVMGCPFIDEATIVPMFLKILK